MHGMSMLRPKASLRCVGDILAHAHASTVLNPIHRATPPWRGHRRGRAGALPDGSLVLQQLPAQLRHHLCPCSHMPAVQAHARRLLLLLMLLMLSGHASEDGATTHTLPAPVPRPQGILTAEEIAASGDVMLRITLLAAGFVIGVPADSQHACPWFPTPPSASL